MCHFNEETAGTDARVSSNSQDTTTSSRHTMADSNEVQVDLPGPSAVAIGKSAYSSQPHSCYKAIQERQQEWHYRLHSVMANNTIKVTKDVCFTPAFCAEPLVCGHQSRKAHSGGEPTTFGYLFNKQQVSHVEGHHIHTNEISMTPAQITRMRITRSRKKWSIC